MEFRGRAWIFGNDVDTDVIIPIQYCGGNDPNDFALHCMEGLDPGFHEKVRHGDIIVAAKNFGCGSSREPAPLAIKGVGISCVIAKSFARIFYRNAFNVGLPLLECSDVWDETEEGDEIIVSPGTGEIKNIRIDKSFQAQPIPEFMQDLLDAGGLMKHVAKRLGL